MPDGLKNPVRAPRASPVKATISPGAWTMAVPRPTFSTGDVAPTPRNGEPGSPPALSGRAPSSAVMTTTSPSRSTSKVTSSPTRLARIRVVTSSKVATGWPSKRTILSPSRRPASSAALSGEIDPASHLRSRAASSVSVPPGSPNAVSRITSSTNAWMKCMIEPADTTSRRLGNDCCR